VSFLAIITLAGNQVFFKTLIETQLNVITSSKEVQLEH